jgi:hypothetical protein
MLTKILLTVGTFTGATTKILQDLDLLADLVLKFVSIVSFIVVIIINMPKLRQTIKDWVK